MDRSHEMTGRVDFLDSMSVVTFDAESEWVSATYDNARESPSLAVVAVIATVLGTDPQALTPLQSSIDTDALDELITASADGRPGCARVTFCYEGFEVTVSASGTVEAVATENT
jgi:hypothetical protein